MTLLDLARQNQEKLAANRQAFRATFDVPLLQFWDTITGFDIVKFDDWAQPPDGTSLKDHLTAKHGEAASKLVADLI